MVKLEPHKNTVIGIKKLSQADLGGSLRSHQTHIGLFENTLSCIQDLHLINFCYLITENETKRLLCLLDYIENPNGTFRSPKIRKGANDELTFEGEALNSVVREIRKVVVNTGGDKAWYLLWFETNNHHLMFILIEYRSKLFDLLSAKIDGIKKRQQFESESEAFFKIVDVLRNYMQN